MFIERDGDGALRAWILPDADDGGEALEFFTGTRQRVASVTKGADGRIGGFIAEGGRTHVADPRATMYDATDPTANGGARYFGGNGDFVDFFQDPVTLQDADGACELELQPIRVLHDAKGGRTGDPATVEKIVMYRESPTEACPRGHWMSSPSAALDLGDGTMLLAMPSRVVRLRLSDLAPVGTAPGLHVIDAARAKAIVATMRGPSGVADPNDRFGERIGAGG